MKIKQDERPIVSIRIDKNLKKKIKELYGGYAPLEKVIEYHFLGEVTLPPSITKQNNQMINHYNQLKKDYGDIHHINQKQIKVLEANNKSVEHKINKINKEITALKQSNKELTEKVKQYKVDDEKLKHSVNVVTELLTENEKQRSKRPTPRIEKRVIKLYSDNCNMKLSKFIDLLPSNLQKCIEE